jgi:hypothetical protein
MSPIVHGCLRKKRYRSKAEAQAQLDQWTAMGYPIDGKVAYGCGCGGGHIGHARKLGRARRG